MLLQKLFTRTDKMNREGHLEWGGEVPFGPYLAIGGMIYFSGASSIIDPWFDPILWLFDNTSFSMVF